MLMFVITSFFMLAFVFPLLLSLPYCSNQKLVSRGNNSQCLFLVAGCIDSGHQ